MRACMDKGEHIGVSFPCSPGLCILALAFACCRDWTKRLVQLSILISKMEIITV
jgi:hypothetical protein